METGRTKPRKKTITIIASATGVDREWLATGNAPVYITETGNPDVGSND
jgi:repressor protein CI family protein